jgi:cytochrome P450
MTMLLAGYETTANTLNWTWYLLALHHVVEQQLRTELESVLGGPISIHLHAHGREESMRFYPLVAGMPWLLTRSAATAFAPIVKSG